MISNSHKQESPIHGSIRAIILKLLWDEGEHRFSEITKHVGKADNVIDRELKILIKKGWVKKPSRGIYIINKGSKVLTNFIQVLDAMPDPDSVYYPINISMDFFKEAFTELKQPQAHPHILDTALQLISMTVAGKNIEPSVPSFLDGQSPNIASIFDFMIKIAMSGLIADLEKETSRDDFFNDENVTDDMIKEHVNEMLFKQDFKLIVSWSPKRK